MKADQAYVGRFQDKEIEKVYYQDKLVYEDNPNRPLELSFPLDFSSLSEKHMNIIRYKGINKIEFIYYKDFFSSFSTVPSETNEYIVGFFEKDQTIKDFYLTKEGSIIWYITYSPSLQQYNFYIVSATKNIVIKDNKLSFVLKHYFMPLNRKIWYEFSNEVKNIKFNNILHLQNPSQPADLTDLFKGWEKIESLSDFNTIGIQTISYLTNAFSNCTNLQSTNELFSNINNSNIIDMKSCFEKCRTLRTIDLSHIRLDSNCNPDCLNYTFYDTGITNLNSQIQYLNFDYLHELSYTFRYCFYGADSFEDNRSLGGKPNYLIKSERKFIYNSTEWKNYKKNYDSNWYEHYQKQWANTFTSYGINPLNGVTLNFNNINFTNLQNLTECFSNSHFNQILLSNNTTSSLTNLNNCFAGLNTNELDITNLNTSNVTDMSYCFCGSYIESLLGISNIDYSNVTTLQYFFDSYQKEITLDLRNSNLRKVTNYNRAFNSENITLLFNFDTNIWTDFELIKKNYFKGFGCNLTQNNIDFSLLFTDNNIAKAHYMFANSKINTLRLENKVLTTDITVDDEWRDSTIEGEYKYFTFLYKGNYNNWENVFNEAEIINVYLNNIELRCYDAHHNTSQNPPDITKFYNLIERHPLPGKQTPLYPYEIGKTTDFMPYYWSAPYIVQPVAFDDDSNFPKDNQNHPYPTYNLLNALLTNTVITNLNINNLYFDKYMIFSFYNITVENCSFNVNPNTPSENYTYLEGPFKYWISDLFSSVNNNLNLTGFQFPEGEKNITVNYDSNLKNINLSNSNITSLVSRFNTFDSVTLQNMNMEIDRLLNLSNFKTKTLDISHNTQLHDLYLYGYWYEDLEELNISYIQSPYSYKYNDVFYLSLPKLSIINTTNYELSQKTSGIVLDLPLLNKQILNLNNFFNYNRIDIDITKVQIHCEKIEQIIFPSVNTVNIIIDEGYESQYYEYSLLNFAECKKLINIDYNGNVNLSKINYLRKIFYNCESLPNQILNAFLTKLNTEITENNKIINFINSFNGCKSLTNIDLSLLTKVIVDHMDRCFANCSNITTINMNNISIQQSLIYLFQNCSSLTQINNLSIIINDIRGLFEGCSSLTSIANIIPSVSIQHCEGCFFECTSFTSIDLSNWNFDNSYINFHSTFLGCTSLTNIALPNLNSIKVNLENTFMNCDSLISINLLPFTNTYIEDLDGTFCNCTSLTNIDLSPFRLSETGVSLKNTFTNCSSLTSLDLSVLRNNKYVVGSLQWAFSGCTNLTNIDLTGVNLRYISNFAEAFSNCTSLKTIKMLNQFYTSTKDFIRMFKNCSSLESIQFINSSYPEYSQLNNRVTPYLNYTDMTEMFSDCISLTTVDFSNINSVYDNIAYTNKMFYNCSSLTNIDLSMFNLGYYYHDGYNFKRTYCENMFENCTSLQSINFMSGLETILYYLDPNNQSHTPYTYLYLTNLCKNCSSLENIDLHSFYWCGEYELRPSMLIGRISIYKKNWIYWNNAFTNCTNLTTIYVNTQNKTNPQTTYQAIQAQAGGEEEWRMSDIDSSLRLEDSPFKKCLSLVGDGAQFPASKLPTTIYNAQCQNGYFTYKA